ncbi:PP2C family protein-serine/threonine phosphatase [Streptomyces sp. Pv4-95]|uniref:PP2C family protein-serine/threonine phosphatase n=1 Tax=Streptomyces sp. Pv4-95 TaxID=3049543 RepID=UPI0038923011
MPQGAQSPQAPAGPPPPDPQARLAYGEADAPPMPGHAPTAGSGVPADARAQAADEPNGAGQSSGPPADVPADPRVAGYEVVADAAAAAGAGTGSGAGAGAGSAPHGPNAGERAAGTPAEDTAAHPTPPQGTRVCGSCRAGAVDADGYCERCGHAQPRQRDHMERELSGIAAVSDRGHRHHRNEDFFALRAAALPDGTPAVVAVVCDGVSSATRPDEASQAASEAAGAALLAALPQGTHPQQAMHDAIMAASTAVDALAEDPAAAHDEHRQQNAPACTFVGAVVGGGLLTVGWVGDSRAYWIPNDRTAPPVRLTEDDSWAAQMIANNLMTEAEANADERAHAITGWLGADAYEVEPHTATFKPDGPGVVVVCTDGLWNYAESADRMAAILPHDAPAQPLNSARTLVTHALDSGGHDNVTVALVPFPAPLIGAGSA